MRVTIKKEQLVQKEIDIDLILPYYGKLIKYGDTIEYYSISKSSNKVGYFDVIMVTYTKVDLDYYYMNINIIIGAVKGYIEYLFKNDIQAIDKEEFNDIYSTIHEKICPTG